MDKKIFNELLESVREAKAIMRGEKKPARVMLLVACSRKKLEQNQLLIAAWNLSLEPIKRVVRRRRKNDLLLQIRQVEHGLIRDHRPICRVQIRILLQHEIGRRNNPGKQKIAARRGDV